MSTALRRRYGKKLPVIDGIQLVGPSGPHKIGMVVPKGGSACVKCKFLRNDAQCALAMWVLAPKEEGGGGGSTFIPAPIDEWCCDGYERRRA